MIKREGKETKQTKPIKVSYKLERNNLPQMLWKETALWKNYIFFSFSIPETAEPKLSKYKARLI